MCKGLLTALRERMRRSQQAPTGDAVAMTSQAMALLDDYQRTGRLDLLEAVIELSRDAVATTPTDHPNHPLYLVNLGNALRIRFERTGQLADLDEAVAVGRDAVATTPADQLLTLHATLLVAALMLRRQ